MIINIHRYNIRTIACDGTLSIDDLQICNTAEHSQHRIPPGTYRIGLRYSRRLGRRVPTLSPLESISRPKRGGFEGHLAIGNGIYTVRDSRILLGTYIAPGCLRRSRPIFRLLYDRINNAQRRGHEVLLSITE